MKVLVTGSNGFIGKNLIEILKSNYLLEDIMEYDRNNTSDELRNYCDKTDAVFHLAAVLRPRNQRGFDDNIDFTLRLLDYLKESNNKCPIMFASSIQADLDNPYGQCKKIEETKFMEYGIKNRVNTYIFRFPNLFGTMSRPNYTSVVSTFCYNTIQGLPLTVNDPAVKLKLAFIENVLMTVIDIVFGNKSDGANQVMEINEYYSVGLGELAYYMQILKTGEPSKIMREDDFYSKLELTYRWYCENYELYCK